MGSTTSHRKQWTLYFFCSQPAPSLMLSVICDCEESAVFSDTQRLPSIDFPATNRQQKQFSHMCLFR